MSIMRPHFKRHHDDEIVDEITMRVVPRWKTSGLSGDEWRVSTVVQLRRKGTVLYERSYPTIEAATAHIPWLLRTWMELPDDEIPEWVKQIERDRELCHQPGCANPAGIVLELKHEFSRQGDGPLPENGPPLRSTLRAFCLEHQHRGDGGREDNDQNYEPKLND